MIKVALIVERADIDLGGAERSIFELACQLSALGVKVTTLAAKGQADAENTRILCAEAPGKRTSLSDFEKALQQHLAKNQYDIIHTTLPFSFADIYQPRGGSFPEAVIRNAASYQNKFVSACKLLTHRLNKRRADLLDAEKRLCCSAGHTIIAALSEYVEDHFKRHYNIPQERISVIPNGVKIPGEPDPDRAGNLRSRILAMFGITEASEPAIFLFAANNFRLKGLKTLLDAIALLKKTDTKRPVFLVVAGSGRGVKYRMHARKLGIAKRIAFLGHLQNIRTALAVSDVAVLPSWYDPSSRFILEALASKKPVITTKFNGAAEMFTNNRHGMIIDDPADPNAMADALNFCADPENTKLFVDNIAGDNLQEKISIATHAQLMIKLYESVLQNRKTK